MQFIKPGINIDFVGIGKRRIAFCISVAMILISIFSLIMHGGPRYGIDFAGGTLIQVRFDSNVGIENIRSGLDAIGLEKPLVQLFGAEEENEYLISTDILAADIEGFSAKLKGALLLATGSEAEVRRFEMVGPKISEELREKALLAMFFALLFITIYISGRFELKWILSGVVAGALMSVVYLLALFNVGTLFLITAALAVTLALFWFLDLKYAMAAIVALIHDVTIVVGIFSVLGMEFTLPVIAALLAIIGYSLNDTIVVFDRIRENLRKYHKDPLMSVINRSINECLSRTLLTSITTLAVVITLFLLGGGIIRDFAFAMIVGVLIGTYSSIYVASSMLLVYQRRGKKV